MNSFLIAFRWPPNCMQMVKVRRPNSRRTQFGGRRTQVPLQAPRASFRGPPRRGGFPIWNRRSWQKRRRALFVRPRTVFSDGERRSLRGPENGRPPAAAALLMGMDFFKFGKGSLAKSFSLKCAQRFTRKKDVNYYFNKCFLCALCALRLCAPCRLLFS